MTEAKPYTPELGQAAFGQPYQEYECPEWLIAFLEYIDGELERVMWNITQERWDSPFGNTANSYRNDVFEVQAYSWDDSTQQEWNFRWGDVRVSWYKWLGRGTTVNREVDYATGARMLEECLASIRALEDKCAET